MLGERTSKSNKLDSHQQKCKIMFDLQRDDMEQFQQY